MKILVASDYLLVVFSRKKKLNVVFAIYIPYFGVIEIANEQNSHTKVFTGSSYPKIMYNNSESEIRVKSYSSLELQRK